MAIQEHEAQLAREKEEARLFEAKNPTEEEQTEIKKIKKRRKKEILAKAEFTEA